MKGWQGAINGTQAPDNPVTSNSINSILGMISRQSPGMERFYSNAMQGNMGDVGAIAERGFQKRQQDTIGQIQSSMPYGTAMSRSLGRETGAANSDFTLQLLREALGRQFQGAQGLQGLPGMYSQAAGLEQANLNRQAGYDQARLGAQGQMYGTQWGTNWDTDTIVEPNWWQMWGKDILGMGAKVAAGAAGAAG